METPNLAVFFEKGFNLCMKEIRGEGEKKSGGLSEIKTFLSLFFRNSWYQKFFFDA
jgi:hypothetical protein